MGMTLKNAVKKSKITSTGVPMKVVDGTAGKFDPNFPSWAEEEIPNLVYEEDGIFWVDIKHLRTNLVSGRIYGNQSAENSSVDTIKDEFLEAIEKGEPANLTPISVWKDGLVEAGNTRYKAAVATNGKVTRLRAITSRANYPDPTKSYTNAKVVTSSNNTRVYTASVKLEEYLEMTWAFRDQFGVDMDVPTRDALIKKLRTSKKTLDNLATIKRLAPELLELVDSEDPDTSISISTALARAKGMDKRGKVIPSRFNAEKIFNIVNPVGKEILEKSHDYISGIRTTGVELSSGIIYPFPEFETSGISGFISHSIQEITGGVLREQGQKVMTATGHWSDPDIRLVKDDNFTGKWDSDEGEKNTLAHIEVKVTQWDGAKTCWKGGKDIREGEYILMTYNKDFTESFWMLTTLMENDWESGGGGIFNKTIMKIGNWWKNHKGNDDYTFWKGRVQDSGLQSGVQLNLDAINGL